jgi:hypothetical protein
MHATSVLSATLVYTAARLATVFYWVTTREEKILSGSGFGTHAIMRHTHGLEVELIHGAGLTKDSGTAFNANLTSSLIMRRFMPVRVVGDVC